MKKKTGPIRVGIIGLGRAGWGMHTPELKRRPDKFTVVAGCDPIPEFRRRFAEHWKCAVFDNPEELVADPGVELVVVASRSTQHVEHALLALRAGKDVFQEKPIATTYRDALRLKAAAAKSRGRIFVRHNRRFEPAFQHVREIIASGLLGNVFDIKLRRDSFVLRDDWQTLLRCGGGQTLNWGPHLIDHALLLLESPAVEIWSDLKRVAAAGDAEDHVRIIMKGRNGRTVDIQISGGAALPEPEYIVLGTRGALACRKNRIRIRRLDPSIKTGKLSADPGTPMNGSFGTPGDLKWLEETVPVSPKTKVDTGSIYGFLHGAIRLGKPFPIKFSEAMEVMRIASLVRKGTRFAPK
ncbi:MAG: Gfo/Idh/MocA family oxidoreductase [Lentisphaerae bacterium]|nr:Gfo/Idh/MocA family oxidoreductase [Lentisphaerota bacterium]